jgi:hypothetical protein
MLFMDQASNKPWNIQLVKQCHSRRISAKPSVRLIPSRMSKQIAFIFSFWRIAIPTPGSGPLSYSHCQMPEYAKTAVRTRAGRDVRELKYQSRELRRQVSCHARDRGSLEHVIGWKCCWSEDHGVLEKAREYPGISRDRQTMELNLSIQPLRISS